MQGSVIRRVSVVAIAALALLAAAANTQAKTEIAFWHAMGGQLGEAVDELVRKFNQSQGEFEVRALYKGTYPEVLVASMAAYRTRTRPTSFRSSTSARRAWSCQASLSRSTG